MHNTAPSQIPSDPFIVSGASSGIGRAIANRLVDSGRSVIGLGRNQGALLQVAEELGAGFEGHVVEFLSDESIHSFVRDILANHEKLGGLIHSAGVFVTGSVDSMPVTVLDETLAVNFRAPFLLTSLFVPRLAAARGTIVFINSSAGLHASTGNSAYCASKFALRALADVARQELNGQGIRVASIYPGRTATPIMERLFEQEHQHYDPALLLQPDDVAAAVLSIIDTPEHAEITDISLRPRTKSY